MTIVYTPRPINPAYTSGIAGFGAGGGAAANPNWSNQLFNLGAGLLGNAAAPGPQRQFIGGSGGSPSQGRGDLGLAATQTLAALLSAGAGAGQPPAALIQPALGLLPRGR